MEPLSALAIATSVVQFVDFSSKILSGSRALQNSLTGLSSTHTDLHQETTTLLKLSKSLGRPVQPGRTRQHRDDLQGICQNLDPVAKELIATLNNIRFKPDGTKWESCYQALRSVWAEERITALQERLKEFRQQLTLTVVVILREDVYSAHSAVKHDIYDMHQEFIKYIKENRQWQTDMTGVIEARYTSDAAYDSAVYSPRNIAKLGFHHSSDEFVRHIMNSLRFNTIDDRHDRISERHRQTFEWVFSETDPKDTYWSNFARWLKSPSPLYWITGKAGSGKSTLMKFLQDDPRTRNLVSNSANARVVEAGFFFWNSGTEMQMSQIGLLRTLLSQILEQCRDYAPVAFPDRWEAFSLMGVVSSNTWSWTELRRAFRRLLEHISRSRLVFMLIDGLDEYSGNHSDLVSFIKELATSTSFNIKICASSRPWVIFEDAFNQRPSLKMQDLTMPDMIQYSSDWFGNNPGFDELRKEEPGYARQLVHEIAEKANGVFLWVILVVHSLLIGLSNGDRVEDLQERLNALPGDLEDLFQRIIDDIDPAYRRHAAELFQIFRAATEPPAILTLAFADQPDIESAIRHPIGALTKDELDSKIDRMRRRLNSRCKGLLEVSVHNFSSQSRVLYLHRTVKDFMETGSRWQAITAMTPDSFEPRLHLAKSYLMQIKILCSLSASKPLQTRLTTCLNYISAAQDSQMERRIRLAEALDSTLCTMCTTSFENSATLIESGPGAFGESGDHWTCTTSLTTDKIPRPGTFMNYMTWSGREWYVKAKLSRGEAIQQDPHFVPLLFSATDPDLITVRQVRGEKPLEFVRFLLDQGANPNEHFQGTSLLWQASNVRSSNLRAELENLLKSYGAMDRPTSRNTPASPVPPGSQVSPQKRSAGAAPRFLSPGIADDEGKGRRWSIRRLLSRPKSR